MKEKNVKIGLYLFLISIVVLVLYYYYPVYSGTYGYYDNLFTLTISGFFFWLDIILLVFVFFSATYGFYHKRMWARNLVIFYLLFVSFWVIVSMFIWQWQVFEHYIYFISYVVFLVFLNLSDVKGYFKTEIDISDYFTYNEYILHKKIVKTKKGKERIFYFFSKELSDSGKPCKLPKNYMVMENKKTKVPYIKMIK